MSIDTEPLMSDPTASHAKFMRNGLVMALFYYATPPHVKTIVYCIDVTLFL